ncbi:MAG: hypothetical protein OEY33_09960 [Bdellovibrionales bacterium]|jgi:hypothetical protein|nr:hypothetical protein [Bdellovibrionales bacterium]
MKLINKYFLLFFISLGVGASNYYPLPFSKQLLDSDGVIRGVFQGAKVRKLASGRIMSEGSFKIIESAGISPAEILNPDDFKVLFPGGIYQGLVHKSFGGPAFKIGEEVVLILSKKSGYYLIHNLALGKYNVQRDRNKTFIISEVFPKNKEIGKNSIEQFNDFVRKKFYQGLNSNSRRVDNIIEDKSRTLASVEVVKEEKDNQFEMFWIVLLLVGLSVLSIAIQNRE